jgi:predicted anti-sigma-YlaC factor YlaD
MILTCREAIARMSAYLDRELGPVDLMRLAIHLAGCAPCRAYLRTLRRTIQVAGRAAHVDMPEEMKQRLRAFLSERRPASEP